MPNITTNHAITYTNILEQNFTCEVSKLHTSQFQDGSKVLKFSIDN